MNERQELEPPDTHYVSAAVGWLELGNPREAGAELDALRPELQAHPRILELRWLICAEQKDWPGALRAARAVLQAAPERASSWLHHAYALRRAPDGGLEKAWAALRPALEQFPTEAVIPYNLACYACQMRRLEEARDYLQRAVVAGGKNQIKDLAIADADLEPLWREIREW